MRHGQLSITHDTSLGTRLITAKARLALLEALSIPPLEFMGAVIGLYGAIGVQRNKATYWVDSCNVGYWIHGQSRNFKPFAALHQELKDSNYLQAFRVLSQHPKWVIMPVNR